MRRAPPALAGAVELPAATHAEMAVERDAAVEVQQQVLAAALDPLELAAVQLGGGQSGGTARTGCADRESLTGQALIQAPGDPEDRVALGHPLRDELAR